MLDENGNVKSAPCGKIYGAFMHFRHCLNPKTMSRKIVWLQGSNDSPMWKRQRTGALRDASRNSQVAGKRFASWTAAGLRRFFPAHDFGTKRAPSPDGPASRRAIFRKAAPRGPGLS